MKIVKSFYEDRQGNIAMIAAIMALPILMLAGVGIDYSRISSAEGNLQATVDNAALDPRRLFRLGPRAAEEIEAFINANSGRETARVRISIKRNKLRIDAKDEIDTPLLSTIGQPKTEITASIEVDGNTSRGSQQNNGSVDSSSRQNNSREVAALRQLETQIRRSLDQLRKAGSRLPLQTRQRMERRLREKLHEVRDRIRQLQSA